MNDIDVYRKSIEGNTLKKKVKTLVTHLRIVGIGDIDVWGEKFAYGYWKQKVAHHTIQERNNETIKWQIGFVGIWIGFIAVLLAV